MNRRRASQLPPCAGHLVVGQTPRFVSTLTVEEVMALHADDDLFDRELVEEIGTDVRGSVDCNDLTERYGEGPALRCWLDTYALLHLEKHGALWTVPASAVAL